MDYRTFVINLSNLDRYRNDLVQTKTDLDTLLYNLSGVKGLSYDQVMVHGNPSVTEQKRLEMIDKYNVKLKEKEFIEDAIEQVETILKRMPAELSSIMKKIYIDGHTFKSVSIEYGYSDHGFWQYLKRETEKYL